MINFVTGGTGFIGKRLVKALQIRGERVRLLSRYELDADTIVCDLEKEYVPNNSLIGVDRVFHLAGFAHDTRMPNQALSIYQSLNIDATIRLANLAVESGVKKFIFVSSIKAGGRIGSNRCSSETDQEEVEKGYAKSKREVELKLLEINEKYDMEVSIVRPSLVYGPNVKGNLRLMLSGIKGGWFPPLPETGNKRSMIHVDDLAHAILLVADSKYSSGEIYNATDGVLYSSREIYNAMCCAARKPVPRWSVPKILFDVAGLLSPKIKHKVNKLLGNECFSSEKLRLLGFRSKGTLKDINKLFF